MGAPAELEHRGMLEQLLIDQAERKLTDVQSAVFLRHFERPESGVASFQLQRVATLGAELARKQKFLFERHQLLLAELARAFEHHAMFFGNREIHLVVPPGLAYPMTLAMSRILTGAVSILRIFRWAKLPSLFESSGIQR